MKKTVNKSAARRGPAVGDARRLAAQLNRRLEERTVELRAAQAEVEAFTHSVSHDLRAPLSHIGGFVDLLFDHLGQRLDKRGKHYLQTITTSTYRMGRMIDDVLDFSRLGQVELHKAAVNLDALTREVIDDLRPQAEKRRVVWLIGHMPAVAADSVLLRQAIVQLAVNALKFTVPREEARIHVGARRGDGEIIFSIRDNGVGFDMKYRERIFRIFQRAHSATEFDGSGIGLAHVARIIQRHGGRTWAEGVPGGGATFYFSLPDEKNGFS